MHQTPQTHRTVLTNKHTHLEKLSNMISDHKKQKGPQVNIFQTCTGNFTNVHGLVNIIGQILFGAYIRQMHFRVASNLPSRDSLRYDLQNTSTEEFRNLDFVKGAYQQPELKAKISASEVVGASIDPIPEEAPGE